jgi:hypothetical protein
MYSHQRCCDLAGGEIARFAAVIRGADPATPVPTCGRWTLADLIQHIGHIHRSTASTPSCTCCCGDGGRAPMPAMTWPVTARCWPTGSGTP